MESSMSVNVLVLYVLFFLVTLILLVNRKRRSESQTAWIYPPGPRPWPIVGNLFDLGTMPHQTLNELKFKYGPLIMLRLGSVKTLVVQSPKVAKEMFKNHDSTFCDRKEHIVYKCHDYIEASMVVGPCGAVWHTLRRLCTTEIMSNKRINESAFIRRKCLDKMIRYIEEDSKRAQEKGGAGEIELCHYIFMMLFNVISNLVLSRDLIDPHSKEGIEFRAAMDKVLVLSGKANMADYLTFLKPFDVQGLKKQMEREMGAVIEIVKGFVLERIEEHKNLGEGMNAENYKDFLDVLLKYEGEDGKDEVKKFTHKQIIIIMLEMFIAGSESTTVTLEWAMAELIKNPNIMTKAQEELDQVVGRNKQVQESDVDELPYFQAVIKEALRLHPTSPLLVPRNTSRDTNLMGYSIPKNTQVFVNVWSIGKDPDSWEDPLTFKPERFLGLDHIDYKGQNFEFLPFGSGRRVCVGLPLAEKTMFLILATLIHRFDWELPNNEDPRNIDMRERMGLGLRKATPLKLVPRKRALGC